VPLQIFRLNGIVFYHPFFAMGLLNDKVVAPQFWIIQGSVESPQKSAFSPNSV
jgi:hypothetical protein